MQHLAKSRSVVALATALLSLHAAAGGRPLTALEDMTVISTAPTEQARSASEGLVAADQLGQRPVARLGELIEFIPGMIATQHSGEGKANQYFLRGFNLDHGTDFATFVDGMPVNMRSHGHGQGYTDLNFLIPETVAALAYRKGPYYADVGDFSAAGSADFYLRRQAPQPLANATLGEFGYRRLFAMTSLPQGSGQWTVAADHVRYEGPWVLDQDLQSSRLFTRYSQGDASVGWDLTLMAYDSEWTATDQVPQRAIESGQIDRLGFIDPTVGGDTQRYSLSFQGRGRNDSSSWDYSLYAIDYALDLYSNFTYFLADPVNGDQFEQLDERQIYGGRAHRHWPTSLAGRNAEWELGGEWRHDAIGDLGLFATRARERLSTIRRDQVDQTSAAAYAQLRLELNPQWTVISGLRLDAYRFDVNADIAANSGNVTDVFVAPKLTLRYQPGADTQLFLNYGRGFHSNDARGVTISVDPTTAERNPVDPVEPLVAADAIDLGLSHRLGTRTQLNASLWALQLDSELVYVGDGGATEASDASERYGVELAMFSQLQSWLLLDMDYAWSHARFDVNGNEDRIPNAVDEVASIGLTVTEWQGWSAGARLRHFGSAPLIEDNSARSPSTTVLNLRVDRQLAAQWRMSLAMYNALGSRDNDITYFYASRLAGEPAAGVEDFHLHPVEPRQLRLTLEWTP